MTVDLIVFGHDHALTLPFDVNGTMVVLVVICALVAAASWMFMTLSAKRKEKKRVAELEAMTAEERRVAKWEAMNLEQRRAAKAEADFRKEVRDGYYSESYLQAIDRQKGLRLRARVKMALAQMDAAKTRNE